MTVNNSKKMGSGLLVLLLGLCIFFYSQAATSQSFEEFKKEQDYEENRSQQAQDALARETGNGSQKNGWKSKAKKAKKELKESKEKIAQLRRKVESLDKQISNLQRKNRELTEKIGSQENKEEKIQNLKNEIARLKNQPPEVVKKTEPAKDGTEEGMLSVNQPNQTVSEGRPFRFIRYNISVNIINNRTQFAVTSYKGNGERAIVSLNGEKEYLDPNERVSFTSGGSSCKVIFLGGHKNKPVFRADCA